MSKQSAWQICIAAVLLATGATGAPADPLPFTGVNLAGGEFYKPNSGDPPQHGTNFIYPNAAKYEYFGGKGMNVFRLPFRWEVLQPTLNAPLVAAELDRLRSAVEAGTSRGYTVILDPHNYARHYGKVIGGADVSYDAFGDFWARLSAEFKDNPRVWFNLMNEPHGMPTNNWVAAANTAIGAIRDEGARNLLLVPGNAYTGAHSWNSNWYGDPNNAEAMPDIYDPLDHHVIEVHQYLDSDSSGTHFTDPASPNVGVQRLEGFVDWAREHGKRAFLGEFAVPASEASRVALQNMLSSMEEDSDVWLGFTWWAAGAWWGDYPFSIQPQDGVDKPQMAYLDPHLAGGLPTFELTITDLDGTTRVLEVAPGERIEVSSMLEPDAVTAWEGDVVWLDDPNQTAGMLTMPVKNIHLTAVPEPASLTLTAAGALVLLGRSRHGDALRFR